MPTPTDKDKDHSRTRVLILGATGSIGRQALQVIEHLNTQHAEGRTPMRFDVVGLAAGSQAEPLFEQAQRFSVPNLALANAEPDTRPPEGTTLHTGSDAAESLVRQTDCDLVLGAMVGAAGLPATIAAVERGIDVAIANKETLVAAGALIVPLARRTGARLRPVDSEHAAIWQCLRGGDGDTFCPPCLPPTTLRRVILTASGGPFRTWPLDKLRSATTADALKHPTWQMGPKVTIDCASLTNKALEIIEAHWLFGLPAECIDALIHPQSIVHAIVEFTDGASVAQLASTDMRIPIQHALTFPRRPAGCADRLDWTALSRLDFEPPDTDRFPALLNATRVIETGGTSGAVFNAANEAAVEAFLQRDGAMPFGRIAELTNAALDTLGVSSLRSLADVTEADTEARRFVLARLDA